MKQKHRRRSHGEHPTPGKACCHVGKSPNGVIGPRLRPTDQRETRTYHGSAASAEKFVKCELNPMPCVFAEVAGKARYLHLVIRASHKHMQTYRSPFCFDTLEPPGSQFPRHGWKMKSLLAAVKPLLSPQPLFLFSRWMAGKQIGRKTSNRRISRSSLATNNAEAS